MQNLVEDAYEYRQFMKTCTQIREKRHRVYKVNRDKRSKEKQVQEQLLGREVEVRQSSALRKRMEKDEETRKKRIFLLNKQDFLRDYVSKET